jgi:hypothetical protein
MIVDGEIYPLHLAVSRDWKVHYFTAALADDAVCRQEEAQFLADMPGFLGSRAMATLRSVSELLAIDYGGVDFALDGNGNVVLFEANATMVVFAPPVGEMWDYRRHSGRTCHERRSADAHTARRARACRAQLGTTSNAVGGRLPRQAKFCRTAADAPHHSICHVRTTKLPISRSIIRCIGCLLACVFRHLTQAVPLPSGLAGNEARDRGNVR